MLFCVMLQYDVPTFMGVVEEETKEEIMETDVPSEGTTTTRYNVLCIVRNFMGFHNQAKINI